MSTDPAYRQEPQVIVIEHRHAERTEAGGGSSYSGNAIAGFVLSLTGISILGVIFSILGMRQAKSGSHEGYGLAIAGLIVGVLGCIFWTIIIAFAIADPAAFDDSYYSY